jgi:hypothetical protein
MNQLLNLPFENKLVAGEKCFDILSHDVCDILPDYHHGTFPLVLKLPDGTGRYTTSNGLCEPGNKSPRYITLQNASALGFVPKEPVKFAFKSCSIDVLYKGVEGRLCFIPHYDTETSGITNYIGKKCKVTCEVEE